MKPCPFCGSEKITTDFKIKYKYKFFCPKCRTTFIFHSVTGANAVHTWNERYNETPEVNKNDPLQLTIALLKD